MECPVCKIQYVPLSGAICECGYDLATLPSDFFDKLREVYQKNPDTKDSWPAEEPHLRQVIPMVAQKLSFNYFLREPYRLGGSGIVIFVADNNLGVDRILKISRPSPGKERYLAKVLFRETETLLRLSHQNLIRILAKGSVSLELQYGLTARQEGTAEPASTVVGDRSHVQDYPYYVMDYIRGADDADRYLRSPNRTQEEVLGVLYGIISAVEYLHSEGQIHMDIKPGNLLVTPQGVSIMSDLGFAKFLKSDNNDTFIGGTDGYIHPEALQFMTEVKTDPNRFRGVAPHDVLKKSWDLYSLGKTLLALLRELETHNYHTLTVYQHRYLRLLACRLLDGRNDESEKPAGLSMATMPEIKYTDIVTAKADFEKLVGLRNLERDIPELSQFTQDTVQTSAVFVTPYTPRVKSLMAHPTVLRLGAFTQLGLLNLIYPTATHTRLEHSLGTFTFTCRYIAALYNDTFNPLFRQLMSAADLRCALVASLLHDLGQCPLAHDLEEAAPGFYSHSAITEELLEKGAADLAPLIGCDTLPSGDDGWAVPVNGVLDILRANPFKRAKHALRGTLRNRILHSLIDGCLDADKLDYLTRDSRQLGLTYGDGIDVPRLLRCLTVVFEGDSHETYAALGIHEKGKVPAESVAFARYSMFGQVYWHHAYRAIKAMLHRIVLDVLAKAADDGQVEGRKFAFARFVGPLPEDGDETLFKMVENVGTAGLSSTTRIQQSDLAVLEWLAKYGGEIAKELVAMLCQRNLYKRILVLSSDRAEDMGVIDAVSKFQEKFKEDGEKRLKLQRTIQEGIVEAVLSGSKEAPYGEDDTIQSQVSAFAKRGAKSALLLLDVPREKSSDKPLEYLVEEDRPDFKKDAVRVVKLERSIVWRGIQEGFIQSIGKIRLFCHPEFSELVKVLVPRAKREEIILGAIKAAAAQ